MSRFARITEDPDYEDWAETNEVDLDEQDWDSMSIALNQDTDAFNPFNTNN
jgi:hypothetical protein